MAHMITLHTCSLRSTFVPSIDSIHATSRIQPTKYRAALLAAFSRRKTCTRIHRVFRCRWKHRE